MPAWIPLHVNLPTHPKTLVLAASLGLKVRDTVGLLVCLWTWVINYADDGDLTKYWGPALAVGAMWDGDADAFCSALLEAGWVDEEAGTYTIHDWQDYAGRLLEKREANRMRVKAWRDKRRAGIQAARNGARNPNELLPNAQRTRTQHAPNASVRVANTPTVQNSTEQKKTVQNTQECVRGGDLAQVLLEVYPHGWGDDGVKRIPSPVDVDLALMDLTRAGVDFAKVLEGARRLSEVKGGQRARYNQGLVRWLRSQGWTARLESVADPDAAKAEARQRAAAKATQEAQEAARGGGPQRIDISAFSYPEEG